MLMIVTRFILGIGVMLIWVEISTLHIFIKLKSSVPVIMRLYVKIILAEKFTNAHCMQMMYSFFIVLVILSQICANLFDLFLSEQQVNMLIHP